MKQKLLLVPVILLLLLGGAWLFFPQPQAQASFSITVPAITGTTTLKPLSVYDLKATGFGAGDRLTISAGTKALGQGVANTSGAYTLTVTIPTSIIYGHYSMTVRNQAGVTATYAMTLAPGLATSVPSGYPGGLFRVEGYGFTPVETITVILNNSADCTTPMHIFSAVARSNAGGGFSINALIPLTATAATTYSVAASGITSTLCAVAP